MENKVISIHRKKKLPIIASSDRVRKPPKPTADQPLIISASELRDFLRCRVKWFWRHQMRIEPLEKPTALAVGALGHNILEKWYEYPRKKRTVKRMRKIANDMLMSTSPDELDIKDLELVKAMCIGYADWAKPRDKELGIDEVKPEMWFEEPLTEDRSILIRGKIDGVFMVDSLVDTVGAFEHKFKGQIKIDIVDLNLQLSVYLWAMRKKFPEAKNYIAYYNVLRKQIPGPRVRADLFAREPVERTGDEIDQWAIDTQRAALDMVDAAVYPNPMDSCSWDCDYQIACILRGRPKDLKHVFKTQYKSKD